MKPILFVDLDESLIKTDILREQLIRSFGIAPWATIKMLFQHGFRPESIKTVLATKISLDVSKLPYNAAVLDLIQRVKKEGRRVVLATATHTKVAHLVAAYLGCFDAVLATTRHYNCKGAQKLVQMQELSGGQLFDYVGDSRADEPIFAQARIAYVVGNRSYAKEHQRLGRRSILFPLLKALHPARWVKNGLIFLPLLIGGHLSFPCFLKTFGGFICFCAIDSALYILKDMMGVEEDRHHSHPQNSPFAKGELTIDEGLWATSILIIIALLISPAGLPGGSIVLGGYIVLTFLYFSLKPPTGLRMVFLSALYTMRILYGQVINGFNDPSLLWVAVLFFVFYLIARKELQEKKG